MLNNENYAGDEVLRELVELKNVLASHLKKIGRPENKIVVTGHLPGLNDEPKELSFLSQLKAEMGDRTQYLDTSYNRRIQPTRISSARKTESSGLNLITPPTSGNPSPLRRVILPNLNASSSPEKTSPRFNVSTRGKPSKPKKSHSNSRKVVKGSNGHPYIYVTDSSTLLDQF